MDCLVATLSVDPVKSHEEWLRDVVAHCENNIEVKFPIIGDADRKISEAFGMLDPGTSDDQDLPLTIRYVTRMMIMTKLYAGEYDIDINSFHFSHLVLHLLPQCRLYHQPRKQVDAFLELPCLCRPQHGRGE